MAERALVEELPKAIEDALRALLAPGEEVLLKMKGAFKEGLICTDRRVIILKGGFMTGQMFGTDAFQQPYSLISGVQVKYSVLSGYFEVSAGGMQNGQKSYWSTKPGSDPAKAPNCVSLNSKVQAANFREAASFILSMADEIRAGGTSVAVPNIEPRATALDTLKKLGELREAGVLTEEEFASKKATLLAQL